MNIQKNLINIIKAEEGKHALPPSPATPPATPPSYCVEVDTVVCPVDLELLRSFVKDALATIRPLSGDPISASVKYSGTNLCVEFRAVPKVETKVAVKVDVKPVVVNVLNTSKGVKTDG
jgi:hypothetical protein